MYEFTNGIVIFDEKTRDRYIEAGYRLVEDKTKEFKKKLCNEDSISQLSNEVSNENTFNNGTIKRQSKKCNKLSK